MALFGITAASAAAGIMATLALSACSSGGEASSAGGAPPTARGSAAPQANAGDIGFAEALIVHDRQGVVVSGMAPTRAVSGQVKSVASAILAADQPQIATLTGWLTAWGAAVPADDMSGGAPDGAAPDGAASTSSADGQSPDVSGLLDGEQVIELGNGSGRAWDVQFLHAMLAFQNGVMRIADAELATGINGPARALAQQIADADKTQVARIRHLLAG